jgi:Tfp pilus assembly protein PilO
MRFRMTHIAAQAAEIGELKQQQVRTQQQVTELKDLKQQMALMSAALQAFQAKVAQR